MQSRKKQNLEVERKIKRQKKMYVAVFAAIALAVVIVIGWVVWDTQNRRFIMTFNGEPVSTGDFRFISILDQQPINEFTRYAILDELLTLLTIMDMADRYGVGFTPEEQAENEESGAFWRDMLEQGVTGALGFIDDRRIGEFMGLHAQVVPRLIDLLITDYEIDEIEFEEALEQQINWLIESGTEVLVKYMAQDTTESHQEAIIELTADEDFDFDDIASRHCVLQTGLTPININDFAAEFGVEIDAWLSGLPIGQFSPTLHGTDYYFNFYVYDRIEPELDLEEIESEFRENFIQNIRTNIFFELLPGWVAEAEYELNRRVFDTIT